MPWVVACRQHANMLSMHLPQSPHDTSHILHPLKYKHCIEISSQNSYFGMIVEQQFDEGALDQSPSSGYGPKGMFIRKSGEDTTNQSHLSVYSVSCESIGWGIFLQGFDKRITHSHIKRATAKYPYHLHCHHGHMVTCLCSCFGY